MNDVEHGRIDTVPRLTTVDPSWRYDFEPTPELEQAERMWTEGSRSPVVRTPADYRRKAISCEIAASTFREQGDWGKVASASRDAGLNALRGNDGYGAHANFLIAGLALERIYDRENAVHRTMAGQIIAGEFYAHQKGLPAYNREERIATLAGRFNARVFNEGPHIEFNVPPDVSEENEALATLADYLRELDEERTDEAAAGICQQLDWVADDESSAVRAQALRMYKHILGSRDYGMAKRPALERTIELITPDDAGDDISHCARRLVFDAAFMEENVPGDVQERAQEVIIQGLLEFEQRRRERLLSK